MKKVKFVDSNCGFYVDPHDTRGKILLEHGTLQKELTNLWRESIRVLSPTIVFNIGVNFREILFSTTYNMETEIIGIEANKQMMPY